MVTTFYPPYHFGGDGTYVRALSEALVKEGHEVTVVHCEDAFRLKANDAQVHIDHHSEVQVYRIKSKTRSLSPLITQQLGIPGPKSHKLRKVFDEKYDVVNFHNISLIGGPGVIGLSKAPVNIYTLHEHWLLCPTHIFWKDNRKACDSRECIRCCIRSGIPPQLWRYTSFVERCLSKIDHFIAPSKYTAEKHRERLPVSAPIDVIPLFSYLSPEPDTSSYKASLQFLYVGRMTASKGIAELLSSFAKWPRFKLKVIGNGDQLENLQRKYGKCGNIEFLGGLAQESLIKHYRQACALILPSLAPETFGLTVVEAFACSTPAIVRDAGGCRETIDQSAAGYIYHNEDELLSALKAFEEDPRLRVSLGRRARQAYEEYYTAEKHVSNYLSLVDSIIQKKAKIIGMD